MAELLNHDCVMGNVCCAEVGQKKNCEGRDQLTLLCCETVGLFAALKQRHKLCQKCLWEVTFGDSHATT